jgi:O-glycosyl hydrolase
MRARTVMRGLTAAGALAAVAVLVLAAPRDGAPAQAAGNLTVDGSERYQTISGWGVNANPKNWGNPAYPPLGPGLDLLVQDLGATLWRVDVYGKSNWETTNQNPDPSQYNWAYYNTLYSTDPAFVALWATLRHLNALGISPILSASGVVPHWMGTYSINNSDAFVNMFASLVYYARNSAGIRFSVVDPLNETDIGFNSPEGPAVPPAQFDTIVSKLKTALVALGMPDVTVLAPETSQPIESYQGALLGDPSVAPFLAALAAHSYAPLDLTFFVNQILSSGYSGLHLWMTEYSSSIYGFLDNGTQVQDEWAFTVAMTQNLFSFLETGASAALVCDFFFNVKENSVIYTYWGLLDTLAGYTPRTRYYGAKQVFAYVRPGSVRIAATTSISGVDVIAFTNDATGAFTIVGMNSNATSQQISGTIANVAMPSSLSLYQTTASLNDAFGGSVSVSGGSFTATVAANSIFTLAAPACAGCPTPTATSTLPAAAATPTPTAVASTATTSSSVGGVASIPSFENRNGGGTSALLWIAVAAAALAAAAVICRLARSRRGGRAGSR